MRVPIAIYTILYCCYWCYYDCDAEHADASSHSHSYQRPYPFPLISLFYSWHKIYGSSGRLFAFSSAKNVCMNMRNCNSCLWGGLYMHVVHCNLAAHIRTKQKIGRVSEQNKMGRAPFSFRASDSCRTNTHTHTHEFIYNSKKNALRHINNKICAETMWYTTRNCSFLWRLEPEPIHQRNKYHT